MFKSLIVSIAKKYILGSLNDFLYRNKDNAKKVSEQIGIWSSRLQAILIDLADKGLQMKRLLASFALIFMLGCTTGNKYAEGTMT